jgi:predicted RNA-binding protein with EMAP domain
MNKAILLKSDDWEGLYINGKLVEEGHTLNQGYSRIKHFVKLAKTYDFDLEEMQEEYLNGEDITMTEDMGNFPEDINEFVENYTL